MLSKARINHIKGLGQKKYRQKEQQFLVEGDKNVLEVLKSPIQVLELFATNDFLEEHQKHLSRLEKVVAISPTDLKKASLLKTPQRSLAVCTLPDTSQPPLAITGLSFYLDGIQDPGNLGTILRICDWFGMDYLFCSTDTVDLFNPKVIQSSMGSFMRIKAVYLSFKELESLISGSEIPVFGTTMNGKSLYSIKLPEKAMIVLGNEGNGIRPEVDKRINFKISIPSFFSGREGAESLNVAVSAGIIGSEFRRQSNEPFYSK